MLWGIFKIHRILECIAADLVLLLGDEWDVSSEPTKNILCKPKLSTILTCISSVAGDITQKGYEKKRSRLLAPYLPKEGPAGRRGQTQITRWRHNTSTPRNTVDKHFSMNCRCSVLIKSCKIVYIPFILNSKSLPKNTANLFDNKGIFTGFIHDLNIPV